MIIPFLIVSFALLPAGTDPLIEWQSSSDSEIRFSWVPETPGAVQETILTMVRPPAGDPAITIKTENHALSEHPLDLLINFSAEILSDTILRHHRLLTIRLNAEWLDDSVSTGIPTIEVIITFDNGNFPFDSDDIQVVSEHGDPHIEAVMNAVVSNPFDLSRWRIPSITQQKKTGKSPHIIDDCGEQIKTASGYDPGEVRFKIEVSETGLYTIPLLPEFSGTDPRTIRLFNRGQELPVRVTGEEDGVSDPEDRLEFIGHVHKADDGSEDPYTDTNVYQITCDGEHGMRSAIFDATPGTGAAAEGYRETRRIEQNDHYFTGEYYWMRIDAGYHEDFTIHTDTPAPSGEDPVLRFRLRGGSSNAADPDHHVRVWINGQQIHDGFFDGYDIYYGDITFSRALLQTGQNTVRLECPGDTGAGSADVIWLDWFEIEYQRYYVSDNSVWFVRSPAPFTPGFVDYTITGFQEPVIRLYRVSDNSELENFTSEQDPINGTFNLRFSKEEHHPSSYIAVTETGLATPVINEDKPSDWKSESHGADYIIISHRDFIPEITRLAEFRCDQGYRVQVVDVEDIYDEFNYGIFSPEAITAFCRYAFHNWQPPAPSAVLLVGDASWDYKNYLPQSVKKNYVPAYTKKYFQEARGDSAQPHGLDPFSDTQTIPADWDFIYGSPMVDDQFVCVAGDDNIPDMMIGRFSVETPEQTTVLVEKTIRYELQSRDQQWQKTLTYITGGFNDAEQILFSRQVNTLIDTFVIPSGTYWRLNHIFKTTDDPWFGMYEDAIRSSIDSGSSIVSFFGHAGSWSWEAMFDFSDISKLNNKGRLPFVASMTCNTARFGNPEIDCFGEAFVNTGNPANGAVAFWGGCNFGGLWTDYYLSYFWHEMLFKHRLKTAGQGILASKALALLRYPSYAVILEPYTYLGDPNLRLGLPSFPSILLAGFAQTSVSSSSGGEMHILAFPSHTDGLDFIDHIELLYHGESTGLYLMDDGLSGDFSAGDGIFGLRFKVPPGIPSGQYGFSLRVVDIEGHTSDGWSLKIFE
jgi:hypothetical protein